MITDTQIILFFFLIIVILFLVWRESQYQDLTKYRSSFDNKEYVVRERTNKKKAANLLAKLRHKLVTFVNVIYKKYPDNEAIQRLKEKFRPENITESSSFEKNTSYSINKGEKIVFCIRQKNKKETIINDNVITFVALHELAHIMSLSIGHTEEFWKNFKFLLEEAVLLGIYTYENYTEKPKRYCGMDITNSPLDQDK